MRRHSLIAAIVCGTIAVALAGCGDSDDKSDSKKPSISDFTSGGKSSSAPSSSSSPTGASDPNASMKFKHDPGQAGKVQDTLTSDGFECTKLADDTHDLRNCDKTGADQKDGSVPNAASVAYYSDQDGTVLLARVSISTILNSDELDTMRNHILESILPAADAAIVEADGSKLTWGEWIPSQLHTGTMGWLKATGFDAVTMAPKTKILSLSKEQALPKFKAEGLKCSFGNELSTGSEDTSLTCYDESFKSTDPNAYDAAAWIRVVDEGSGITGITVAGERANYANDRRALKELAPKLSALGDSDDLKALSEWITSHADGRPHAGYVGLWSVDVAIAGTGTLLGDSMTVDASPEVLALGLSEDQQAGQGG